MYSPSSEYVAKFPVRAQVLGIIGAHLAAFFGCSILVKAVKAQPDATVYC